MSSNPCITRMKIIKRQIRAALWLQLKFHECRLGLRPISCTPAVCDTKRHCSWSALFVALHKCYMPLPCRNKRSLSEVLQYSLHQRDHKQHGYIAQLHISSCAFLICWPSQRWPFITSTVVQVVTGQFNAAYTYTLDSLSEHYFIHQCPCFIIPHYQWVL